MNWILDFTALVCPHEETVGKEPKYQIVLIIKDCFGEQEIREFALESIQKWDKEKLQKLKGKVIKLTGGQRDFCGTVVDIQEKPADLERLKLEEVESCEDCAIFLETCPGRGGPYIFAVKEFKKEGSGGAYLVLSEDEIQAYNVGTRQIEKIRLGHNDIPRCVLEPPYPPPRKLPINEPITGYAVYDCDSTCFIYKLILCPDEYEKLSPEEFDHLAILFVTINNRNDVHSSEQSILISIADKKLCYVVEQSIPPFKDMELRSVSVLEVFGHCMTCVNRCLELVPCQSSLMGCCSQGDGSDSNSSPGPTFCIVNEDLWDHVGKYIKYKGVCYELRTSTYSRHNPPPGLTCQELKNDEYEIFEECDKCWSSGYTGCITVIKSISGGSSAELQIEVDDLAIYEGKVLGLCGRPRTYKCKCCSDYGSG